MIKSMTGYGRSSKSTPLGRFVIEIHSVNRKMLDLSVYLPKDFLRFDVEIRKWLSQVVERGQVTLRLTVQSEGIEARLLSTYFSQLKSLKEGWEELSSELGFDPQESIKLSFLVSQMQPMPLLDSKEEEESIKETLKELVADALKGFLAAKQQEGKALAEDLLSRLIIIEETLALIEEKREDPLIRCRQKLETLLKETGQTQIEMDERLLREVAVLAEKMDVTEEIVRLKTHIHQFKSHLKTQEKSIGRTLDFCLQEMHREINTLGSKSVDSAISVSVVKIKSELEKIREQVQNIE